MLCVVERDLNQHLDAEDFLDSLDEAVECQANELMQEGEKFYPFNSENISEAIGNSESLDVFLVALKEERYEDAGKAAHQLSMSYWAKIAHKAAFKSISDEMRGF